MIELNLNGYTDIPNGKVANIATYLEICAHPGFRPADGDGLTLFHMEKPDVARYHALFKAIGEDWLWFSRLTMDIATLEATISRPEFEIFIAQKSDEDFGLLELDIRDPGNIELAYFGLAADAVGTGAGRWLMNTAIARVFEHHKASRFFVHTCTMDSPQALAFYMRSGFKPYKRAVEIADDPRLTGHIPRDKGSYHPIIE